MKSALKRDHGDIISKTKHSVPENYEVINFKIYLSRIFSSTNFFIDSERVSSFRKQLLSKFENETTCFKKYGTLKKFEFTDLYYYQEIIGISGPKHSKLNDPVFILKVNKMLVLWNGYHRLLIKMRDGQTSTQGYILEI